jgi:hypothetical protein
MKKLLFPMIVALVAAFSFVSCSDDEKSDEDLTKNIIKYQTYVGTDSANDKVTATFNPASFNISYDDFALVLSGAWAVSEGQLILIGEDNWNPGIIGKDGKELTLSSGDGTTFALTKK